MFSTSKEQRDANFLMTRDEGIACVCGLSYSFGKIFEMIVHYKSKCKNRLVVVSHALKSRVTLIKQ